MVGDSTLTSHAHTRAYTTHHTNLTVSHVIDLVVLYFGAAGVILARLGKGLGSERAWSCGA